MAIPDKAQKFVKFSFYAFSVDILTILSSKLMALWRWRCSYYVPKTICILYWVHYLQTRLWEKINQVRISCPHLVSGRPKSGCFFGRFTVELVWKSFSARNNSLEPPVFLFSNSRLHGLKESIKRVERFD